jgi:DMSO reductase anchor subunit
MRPTFSLILFTTLSGAGYGMWFFAGSLLALGQFPNGRGGLLVTLAIGLVLTTTGLLCSVGHLGQPLRAWRAFTQWRSSWLSREAVAALLCVAPVLLLAAKANHDHDFIMIRAGGFALAVMSLLVVFCTARIYTSLRTIDAWHNPRVMPGFVLLALETGAIWFWVWLAFRGDSHIADVERYNLLNSAWLLVVATTAIATTWNKLRYWKTIDSAASESNMQTATGLGQFGHVRSLEHPHTESNYLTHEMGFQLARRHSRRLRSICVYLLLIIPLIAVGGACLFAELRKFVAPLALGSAMLGVMVERWMFFAEAEHKVMLYYGAGNRVE